MFKRILALILMGSALQAADWTQFDQFMGAVASGFDAFDPMASFFHVHSNYLNNLVYIESGLQALGSDMPYLVQTSLTDKQSQLIGILGLPPVAIPVVLSPAELSRIRDNIKSHFESNLGAWNNLVDLERALFQGFEIAPADLVRTPLVKKQADLSSLLGLSMVSGVDETKSFVATGEFLDLPRQARDRMSFVTTPGLAAELDYYRMPFRVDFDGGSPLVYLRNNYSNFQGALPSSVTQLLDGIPVDKIDFYIDINAVSSSYRAWGPDGQRASGYKIVDCGCLGCEVKVVEGQGLISYEYDKTSGEVYLRYGTSRRIISYWIVSYVPGKQAKIAFQILIDKWQLSSDYMSATDDTADLHGVGDYLPALVSQYTAGRRLRMGGFQVSTVNTLRELLSALKSVFNHEKTEGIYASLDPADKVTWNQAIEYLEKLYGKVS